MQRVYNIPHPAAGEVDAEVDKLRLTPLALGTFGHAILVEGDELAATLSLC
jgi:hypothetical protein